MKSDVWGNDFTGLCFRNSHEVSVGLACRLGYGGCCSVPDAIESLCCSTPWTSKGYTAGRDTISKRVIDAIRATDPTAQLHIISDAASCTEGFAHLLHDAGINATVEDAIAFTTREILPRLGDLTPTIGTLALHPTCSSTQMGLNPDLEKIAHTVAKAVIVPDSWGCCAFAGDRGMLHPELAASAPETQAAEIRALNADAHASCNRTCELGMTRATDANYEHLLELLAVALE